MTTGDAETPERDACPPGRSSCRPSLRRPRSGRPSPARDAAAGPTAGTARDLLPDGRAPRRRPVDAVRAWHLWALPRRALVFVLTVDVLAVVLGVAATLAQPLAPGDGTTLLVLMLGTAVHLECVRRVERVRHSETSHGRTPYIDAKSMWSFAGLILMSTGPALALVVFSLTWWWVRVSRRPFPHRWIFSGATVVIASVAAAAVLAPLEPDGTQTLGQQPAAAALLAAAALVRWTVNHGLVVSVIGLSAPSTSWRQRLGSLTDNLIGLGALGLGIALAVLVRASPWLVPILLVPVLAMHQGVLLGHFARAARSDPKTGVWSIGHWREQAVRALDRARRRTREVGVLMLDLDEFKSVNDRWGHLVGDQVLRAVADALREELRSGDAVGRFGGEEFVVLVDDVTSERLAAVAERLRTRVAGCRVVVESPDAEDVDGHVAPPVVAGLTASVGAATYPGAGTDLDQLVRAADRALYRAKRAGRDRVATADDDPEQLSGRPRAR